jgi:hypothetical protein
VSGIIRSYGRPNDSFTIVSNAMIRDAQIKPNAFRIALYVMSNSAEFRLTQTSIARALKLNRTTVLDALGQLEGLGYLARTRHHSAAGRQPDDLHISQVPMTPEEWQDAIGAHVGKANVEKARVGKTDSVRRPNSKKTKEQEEQLSEGDTAAAAPAEEPDVMEDAVKTKDIEPVLFEVEAPPKPPAVPSCKDVTAAYVDSFRAAHSRDPLRSDVGRVASSAKALLTREEATVEELINCAKTMGTGTWSNLGQELKNSRRTGRPTTSATSLPILHGDSRWDEAAERTRRESAALAEANPNIWDEVSA